jgi:hypothetical protein
MSSSLPPPPLPYRPPAPIPRNISHAGHAIATLLTVGLWAPCWLIASVVTSQRNQRQQEAYARALAKYEYEMAVYFGTVKGLRH